MLNGYRIIDADSHVIEPTQMWGEYLEPKFKQFAPTAEMAIAGEKVYYKISPEAGQKLRSDHEQLIEQHYQNFLLSNFNPESYVKVMKQTGVDMAFLYPTYGQWLWAIDSMPALLAGAFTRAYNNWLRDYCSYDPQVLRGVGAINLHSPEEMVPQLHQIADNGWRAVYLRPNPVKGRLLSDSEYEPFWTECERLGIAVGLHEGTHSRLPTIGSDRFSTRFALHACSHPIEQMMALLALIEGGVLERHPSLRVGFLESGCGWLPYWLWRLDHVYEDVHWEVADRVKMKPSEYFRRQCFIALEPYEPYLAEIVDYIGSDNLIFGSDYPHVDHKPSILADAVTLEEQLPKTILEKILWDNPARFYGLEST
ncbi:amidohydrolase [Pleurocapsales cyanobacterium LEGE 10410]|nr:amidohydrolase [Pleurocapsales cyanobacterium LEGE 10410]